MKTRYKFACAVLALLPVDQIMAQDRTILPIPAAPFTGTA